MMDLTKREQLKEKRRLPIIWSVKIQAMFYICALLSDSSLFDIHILGLTVYPNKTAQPFDAQIRRNVQYSPMKKMYIFPPQTEM